jgi:hypothetical protein
VILMDAVILPSPLPFPGAEVSVCVGVS